MPISKEQIADFITAHKDEFFEQYGVCKIGLFGSIVRGEQSESSDIDIAIEMEPGKKNLRNFLLFKRYLEKESNSLHPFSITMKLRKLYA